MTWIMDQEVKPKSLLFHLSLQPQQHTQLQVAPLSVSSLSPSSLSPSRPLCPPQPRTPVCIYVWNHQTKASLTSHQVKKACPGTSNSLPKMPGFKSSQEGCLSLKFKWIALGHKLSGEGGRGEKWREGLPHLSTKLTHPTGKLRAEEKKNKN